MLQAKANMGWRADTRTRLAPSQVLAVSFLLLIAAGTLLLALPVSAEAGRLSLVDAFFTATSAVCVTGLIVFDTPNVLSTFGEIVLLLLIQLGGLGYMTISSLIVMTLGGRVSLHDRLILQEGLHAENVERITRFVLMVLGVTLVFELSGALVLTLRWASEFGLLRGAYLALFHSVSAFNNAGFSLFSLNLIPYRGDLIVNLIVAFLIIAGGIGFVVLTEIGELRRRRVLSLHTKVVLGMTSLLLVGGTVSVFLLERNNPRSLAPLPAGEAWLASFFQAVAPRTAGFNTIDIGALGEPTLFIMMALMFIGASPGGTGGGVKTSTFAVTVLALWATVRGQAEPRIFYRRLSADLVARSFFICLIGFLVLNVVAGVLLVLEQRPLLATLFEATSALGTVGLSMGVSGQPVSLVGLFSSLGKILIALLMFAGRVGPLTLAVALGGGEPKARLRYPEGKVLIG